VPTITGSIGGREAPCVGATGRRRLAISASVACAELGDELVLLDTEGGVYFGLDAVGAAIWRLVAAGSDEAAILDQLLAEYDVEPERLAADVSAFLDLVEARGLARSATE
jgi:hypothetical protein